LELNKNRKVPQQPTHSYQSQIFFCIATLVCIELC
jgi:hypothetical protein